jgi:hypothetical protein
LLPSRTPSTTNIGVRMQGKKEHSCTAGGNVSWCNQYGTQYRGFLKIQIDLPYDPAIPFLGIYPKE